MRRDVVYAAAAVVGIGVLVLAGLGVASLIDNDRELERDESIAFAEARNASFGAVNQVTKWWAIAHRRDGERIAGSICDETTRSLTGPFRYGCKVTLRDRAGRYRGWALRLAESQSRDELEITRVRPRRAGPVGAPQQAR